MRRRAFTALGRTGGWTTGLAAFVLVVAAACGSATAPSSGPTSGDVASDQPSSAGPSRSTGPAITSDPSASLAPGGACELSQQPGPDDAPPQGGGDLMDNSDMGGGRWRVCLEVPLAATAEASAWCLWDEGRTAVTEISGLPASVGTVDYDAWLSFAAPAFEFHATDTGHGGIIANYATDTGPVRVQLDADGRGGIARFDVGMRADPESGPAEGAPARYGGVMRWRCGDAPAAA
jgi:hypothetical protein